MGLNLAGVRIVFSYIGNSGVESSEVFNLLWTLNSLFKKTKKCLWKDAFPQGIRFLRTTLNLTWEAEGSNPGRVRVTIFILRGDFFILNFLFTGRWQLPGGCGFESRSGQNLFFFKGGILGVRSRRLQSDLHSAFAFHCDNFFAVLYLNSDLFWFLCEKLNKKCLCVLNLTRFLICEPKFSWNKGSFPGNDYNHVGGEVFKSWSGQK